MPVIAERRQIDKGDRRARTGAIGLEHCMREARFEIVVVHRVEPDLGGRGYLRQACRRRR